jgi:tetratricopeptide (TPR) repeat protein
VDALVWVLKAAVVVVLVAAVLAGVRHVRSARQLRRLAAMLDEGRHDEVLAHAPLAGPYERVADRLRSTSALLTGRYDRTLDLLEGPHTAADAVLAPTDVTARAGSLLGMGRYAEAAAVLGDDPVEPLHRHLRAQVAVETGDDETARRLLAFPDADLELEAGRKRILGDLLIRRGQRDEGEALVRQALAVYLASAIGACQVDAGYCHVHLAESAIAQGRGDTALAHLQTAQALLEARPDNAPGFALLHLRRAEALALTGDATAAAAALDSATTLTATVPSRSLAAAVQHVRGVVAFRLGNDHQAAEELRLAQRLHEALGEVRAAQEAAALLAELDHRQ